MMKSLNWISAKYLISAQHEWEIWLKSNKDLINQDSPTHWVLFLSCDVVFKYISIKIVYFPLKSYGLSFIVKVVVAWSQQVKCSISLPHDITVNTHCLVIMDRWHCQGNYMMLLSANNHLTKSLDLLYNVQENLDLLYKIQVVGKHRYFTSKAGSNHTSQNNHYHLLGANLMIIVYHWSSHGSSHGIISPFMLTKFTYDFNQFFSPKVDIFQFS